MTLAIVIIAIILVVVILVTRSLPFALACIVAMSFVGYPLFVIVRARSSAIMLSELLIGAAFVVWLTKPRIATPRIFWWILALYLFSAGSSFGILLYGIDTLRAPLFYSGRCVEMIILFRIAATTQLSDRQFRGVEWAMVIVGSVVGVAVFAHALGIIDIGQSVYKGIEVGGGVEIGVYGELLGIRKQALSVMLILSVSAGLALSASLGIARRWLPMVLATLVAFGVVFTASRSGIMALGVAFVWLLIKLRNFRALAYVTVGAIGMVLAWPYISDIPVIQRRVVRGMLDLVGGDVASDPAVDARLHGWRALMDFMMSHPWAWITGVGHGAFLAIRNYFGYGHFSHAHNTYLQFLAEMGLIGLALFVGVYATIWRIVGRIIHADLPGRNRLGRAAVSAGFMGLATACIATTILAIPQASGFPLIIMVTTWMGVLVGRASQQEALIDEYAYLDDVSLEQA